MTGVAVSEMETSNEEEPNTSTLDGSWCIYIYIHMIVKDWYGTTCISMDIHGQSLVVQ